MSTKTVRKSLQSCRVVQVKILYFLQIEQKSFVLFYHFQRAAEFDKLLLNVWQYILPTKEPHGMTDSTGYIIKSILIGCSKTFNQSEYSKPI